MKYRRISLRKLRCAFCDTDGIVRQAPWAWDPNTVGAVPCCTEHRDVALATTSVRVVPIARTTIYASFVEMLYPTDATDLNPAETS